MQIIYDNPIISNNYQRTMHRCVNSLTHRIKYSITVIIVYTIIIVNYVNITPCGAQFIRVAPNSSVWRPIHPKSRAITLQSRPLMTNADPGIETRSGTLIASGQAARPTDAWIDSGQWDVSARWQSPSVSLASGVGI